MKRILFTLTSLMLFYLFIVFYMVIVGWVASDNQIMQEILYVVKTAVFILFITQILSGLLYFLIAKINISVFSTVVFTKQLTWLYWFLLLGVSQLLPFPAFSHERLALLDIVWLVVINSSAVLMFVFEAYFIHRFNKEFISFRKSFLLSLFMNICGALGIFVVIFYLMFS